MRKRVHGVNAPCVARVVVVCAANTVNGRVAHIDVGVCHVDFGTQHSGTVGQFALAHVFKTCQVVGNAAAAEWAVYTGGTKVATVFAHVFGALLIHIGQALFDQIHSGAVHGVEIVAGKIQVANGCSRAIVWGYPSVANQPLHGVGNGVYILLVFFFWIGVVKTQMANAVVVACQTKVNANAFGMPNVQITVRFWWETGTDFGRV